MTAPVAVRETHIGVVVLAGDRAFKLKKPVDLGFLDFSTRERRLAACRREVELNRRLCPDVYLGVADVTDEHGDPCDHLVVMRRMPADRRLAHLLAAGAPLRDEVRAIARRLAAFHASADRSPAITCEGGRDAIAERWNASIEQVAASGVLPPELLTELADRVRSFLAGRERLFADRQDMGRVVDGHGDLIAEDVFCLDDGPRILDCLEFDDRLRFVDGLDDAAFLAMDLERHGRADLADAFLDDYAEFAADPAPASLRHHYVAYRAFVRAKVACLRHVQLADTATSPLVGAATTALADAVAHTELALRHLRAGAVRLVLVGGLPGSGKSTVAAGLADHLGAVLLSSDRLRKELAGLPPEAPHPDAYGKGLHTADADRSCYAELLHRAGRLLRRGETVILDASWIRAADRDAARSLACATSCDIVELRCDVDAAEAARRIARRHAAGPTTSDATAAIAAAMAADADPWPEAAAVPTAGSCENSLGAASAAIAR